MALCISSTSKAILRKATCSTLAPKTDAHFLPASERGVESTPREPASLDQLAEWIFARHVRGANPFDKRYSEAMKDNTIEGFKKADFRIAYRRVYETEPHRPLATGWPLRSPYRDRVRME